MTDSAERCSLGFEGCPTLFPGDTSEMSPDLASGLDLGWVAAHAAHGPDVRELREHNRRGWENSKTAIRNMNKESLRCQGLERENAVLRLKMEVYEQAIIIMEIRDDWTECGFSRAMKIAEKEQQAREALAKGANDG